jgi:thymidine kinase
MNISVSPCIDVIIGPMFSGKTTEIIRRIMIYYQMGLKVLYINSLSDVRSDKSFSSHNTTIGRLPFESIKLDKLSDCKIENYDVIAIDESQFFDDLKVFVLEWCEQYKKIIIVGGLNSDFQRKPFGQINELIPYADNIIKLSPFCTTCKQKLNILRQAIFTKRISTNNNDIVLIGGKDLYIPVCRECYF